MIEVHTRIFCHCNLSQITFKLSAPRCLEGRELYRTLDIEDESGSVLSLELTTGQALIGAQTIFDTIDAEHVNRPLTAQEVRAIFNAQDANREAV